MNKHKRISLKRTNKVAALTTDVAWQRTTHCSVALRRENKEHTIILNVRLVA